MTRRAVDRYGTCHTDDSYGRLDAFCERHGYKLGIATLKRGMEMRVESADKAPARIATSFQPGHENSAASYLLGKLNVKA